MNLRTLGPLALLSVLWIGCGSESDKNRSSPTEPLQLDEGPRAERVVAARPESFVMSGLTLTTDATAWQAMLATTVVTATAGGIGALVCVRVAHGNPWVRVTVDGQPLRPRRQQLDDAGSDCVSFFGRFSSGGEKSVVAEFSSSGGVARISGDYSLQVIAGSRQALRKLR